MKHARTMMRSFGAAALMSGLLGCAVAEIATEAAVDEEPAVGIRQVTQVEQLLNYYEAINHFLHSELQSEYVRSRSEFLEVPSDDRRMRLALLMILPHAALADDDQVLEILDPVIRERALQNDGVGELALILVTLTQEHRRAMSSLRAAVQRLTDERKRADAVEQRLASELHAQAQRAREEQERADVLQKRLDEIRKIEEDMMGRVPGGAKRP